MAWSTPFTAVANQTFTAADFNQFVRDNLEECAPHIATATGEYFVGNGQNDLVVRSAETDVVNTQESSSSTSFTDLSTVGPQVTVSTGTSVIVFLNVECRNNTADVVTYTSFDVSGATTRVTNATEGVWQNAMPATEFHFLAGAQLVEDLTAGSNTFTMKYKVSAGTGEWLRREISVFPL